MSAKMSLQTATSDMAISLMAGKFFSALATAMYLPKVLKTAALMPPVRMLMKLMVLRKIYRSDRRCLYSREARSIE